MKWSYSVRISLDTNDGDYIHEDSEFGIFDDENDADVKMLAGKIIAFEIG